MGSISVVNKNYNRIYVGGVLGYASGITLTRCISSANCYGESKQTPCVGGLIGYMESTTNKNCLSLGSGNAKSTGNYEPYANKLCANVKSGSSTGCYTSVTYTEAFFTSTLGFSSSVWDLSHVAEGKLPTLIQS